jgi:NAD(P)-dependent dehydrogenase (short-subunit alcohol dehydrogenase family)
MASPIELVEIKRVQEFIEKYTKGFPHHHPSSSGGRPGNVVLLTGSTGQLGTALLTQLALCDNVTKIYAFNRRSKTETTMKQRHYEAFIERGLDIAILESPKVVFVEGDTSDATLGISKELFSEVSPA